MMWSTSGTGPPAVLVLRRCVFSRRCVFFRRCVFSRRCLLFGRTASSGGALSSAEAWQVMRELCPPGGPVVGDVVAPQVKLVRDSLAGEQACHLPRRVQRSG